MKKLLFRFFCGLLVAGIFVGWVLNSGAAEKRGGKRVLVVTVTKGFRHSSIPTAEKVIGELAAKSHAFTVDYVRNDQDMAEKMTAAALKNYDGFIFANTTGILPLPDKEAFLNAIKGGKGFIAMHSGCDTFHGKDGIDPYIEMLGGEFETHHAQVGVECLVQDPKHSATRHLGQSFKVKQEEIYLIKNYSPAKVHELLVLDKHPNDKTPGHFPISWCKEYGKGKVFYTSLGHREDIWDADPDLKGRINPVEVSEAYQKHILGGIEWALGLKKGDVKPQAK